MKTFLLATAIGALAASSVLAYDTEARTGLRARLAVNIAEMAAAACAVDGYNVSAAVTDRSGALLALIRYEKASAGTIDASVQKAFSSASSHSPTSAMVENLVGSPNEAAFTDISGHFVSGVFLSKSARRRSAPLALRARRMTAWTKTAPISQLRNLKRASSETSTTIRFLKPASTGSVTWEIGYEWCGTARSGP
ncbi:uncharacterized protein GlcG (DUF336 family) [Agrobacterium sp. RC10-4-1]|nr:uncharacterized protein GlcG (DUF336 family) [Agrobacterium sp. RC10-4-1]